MILSFKNISINGVQVLVNQCLGMGVFLLLSRYLDKSVFGEFSWSLAVLTLTLTLSGLGLDQIVVRNVAAGKEASHQLTLFAFHTGLMVLLLAGGLLAGYYGFPAFFTLHPVLWMLAISQALTSFALPFRQLITGKSAYGWLAIQATVPNLVRLSGLIMLALLSMLTMRSVLLLFILSSLLEYLTGFYIVIKRLGIPFYRRIPAGNYISLIRDSLPQAGMIFLQMGIARADWILLGLFSTAVVTAEYSFAYRAYELSPLPLLILAPLLLNRFAKEAGAQPGEWLDKLIRAEMIAATFLPLLLNLGWTPLMDFLTGHKYGSSNATIFLILSCCIPFQYLINLRWSFEFAANRLSLIFRITAITAVVVLAGDALIIPYYGGMGAALIFLAGMVLQYFLYRRYSSLVVARKAERYLWIGLLIAFGSGWVALQLSSSWMLQLLAAAILYAGLAWVSGLIKTEDGLGLLGRYAGRVDWGLLSFLIFFLNVKLYVKIVAILLAVWLHRSERRSRGGWWKGWMGFYVGMLVLAVLNWLLSVRSWTLPAFLSFITGCSYWLLALAAAWQLSVFVQKGDREKIHRTLEWFFILHIICSLLIFLWICIDCGSINPFLYQGMHQKYFINTGDFIRGISFDSSITGALISAFGLLYFLYRGRNGLSLACMIVLLLAGSNLIDLLLGVILLLIFFIHTSRVQKSMILVYLLSMVVFWGKVSPENRNYAEVLASRMRGNKEAAFFVPSSHPRMNDLLEKGDVVHRKELLRSFQDSVYRGNGLDSLQHQYKDWDRAGKWVALRELGDFFRLHPGRLLLGAGMGNFASHLAFKTTALDIGGSYPMEWRYIHPFFRDHFFSVYLYYYTRDQGRQSIVNSPDSVYFQLLGEYGLAGLLCFFIFYLADFGRHFRSLSYGLPLLLLLGGAFLMEFWFEQLSVVVLFELLLLLDKPAISKYES